MNDLHSGRAIGPVSLRENARRDNEVSGARGRLEQAQEEEDRVEQAAREPAHDGAVDADVLEVVARVILDEPDGAFGAEREHALLDEGRETIVGALDRLDHAPLDPAVDVAA